MSNLSLEQLMEKVSSATDQMKGLTTRRDALLQQSELIRNLYHRWAAKDYSSSPGGDELADPLVGVAKIEETGKGDYPAFPYNPKSKVTARQLLTYFRRRSALESGEYVDSVFVKARTAMQRKLEQSEMELGLRPVKFAMPPPPSDKRSFIEDFMAGMEWMLEDLPRPAWDSGARIGKKLARWAMTGKTPDQPWDKKDEAEFGPLRTPGLGSYNFLKQPVRDVQEVPFVPGDKRSLAQYLEQSGLEPFASLTGKEIKLLKPQGWFTKPDWPTVFKSTVKGEEPYYWHLGEWDDIIYDPWTWIEGPIAAGKHLKHMTKFSRAFAAGEVTADLSKVPRAYRAMAELEATKNIIAVRGAPAMTRLGEAGRAVGRQALTKLDDLTLAAERAMIPGEAGMARIRPGDSKPLDIARQHGLTVPLSDNYDAPYYLLPGADEAVRIPSGGHGKTARTMVPGATTKTPNTELLEQGWVRASGVYDYEVQTLTREAAELIEDRLAGYKGSPYRKITIETKDPYSVYSFTYDEFVKADFHIARASGKPLQSGGPAGGFGESGKLYIPGQELARLGRGIKKKVAPVGRAVGEFGEQASILYGVEKQYLAQRWGELGDTLYRATYGQLSPEIRQGMERWFGTTTRRLGVKLAQLKEAIWAEGEIARLHVLDLADRFTELSEEQLSLVSEYLRPGIAGTKAVRPTGLVPEEAILAAEKLKQEVQTLIQRKVKLGLLDPRVAKEYAEGWFPRLYEEYNFLKTGQRMKKQMLLSPIEVAHDAFGLKVRMLEDDAKALMGPRPATARGSRKPIVGATLDEEREFYEKYKDLLKRDIAPDNYDWLLKRDRLRKIEKAMKEGRPRSRKRIWEMTLSEYNKPRREPGQRRLMKGWQRSLEEAARGKKGYTQPPVYMTEDQYRRVVEKAFREGKPVPQHVLDQPMFKDLVEEGSRTIESPALVKEMNNSTLIKFTNERDRAEFMRRLQAEGYDMKHTVQQVFNPLSKTQREELRQLVDPRLNAYNAIRTLRQDIAKEHYFRTLIEQYGQGNKFKNPVLVAKSDPAAVPGYKGPGFKRLDRSYRLGSLGGWKDEAGKLQPYWVRADVHDDLLELTHMFDEDHGFFRWWRRFLTDWKAGKTIWSVRTHFRNFFGNVPFAVLAGNAPWWSGLGFKNQKWYRQAGRVLESKRGALYEEMLRHGIVGTQYADEELKLFNSIYFAGKGHINPEESANRLYRWGKAVAEHMPFGGSKSVLTQSRLARRMGRIYNWSDSLYRAATYIKAREHWGMSALEAMQHVDRWFPNYSQVGKAFKVLSKTPLGGPFGRFAAEAFRIGMNGIRYEPVKMAAVLAAPWLIGQTMKAALGIGETEWQAMRMRGLNVVPVGGGRWSKGLRALAGPAADLLWGEKDLGPPQSVDLTYWTPWGSFMTGVASVAGVETQYNRDSFWRKLMDLFGPFALSNPAFTLPVGMLTNRDPYSGREIVPKYSPEGLGFVQFTAEQLSPGLAPIPTSISQFPWKVSGRDAQKILDRIQGLPYRSGEKRTWAKTVSDALVGVGFRTYDPQWEQQVWGKRIKQVNLTEAMALGQLKRPDYSEAYKRMRTIDIQEGAGGDRIFARYMRRLAYVSGLEARIRNGEKGLIPTLAGAKASVEQLKERIDNGEVEYRRRTSKYARRIRERYKRRYRR